MRLAVDRELLQRFGRHRLGEQVALVAQATATRQYRQLGLGLDPFGNHFEAKGRRQRSNGDVPPDLSSTLV